MRCRSPNEQIKKESLTNEQNAMVFKLNLRMFGEGGGEGGAEGGAVGTEAGVVADTNGEVAIPDQDAEFESLIKGKFKENYDKRVQATVQNRVKNLKASADEYERMKPMLTLLKGKYGVESDKIEDLVSAIEDDDSFYENEAFERGVSVAEMKHIHKLERENEELRKAEAERTNKERADALISKWVSEGEALKSVYPSFDLRIESQNETFTRLLQSGIDVRTAFEVVHKGEIDNAKVSLVAKETEKRIAQSVQAGKARPAESGSRPSAPMKTNVDVNNLTYEQMDDLIRRAKMGEKISFK